MGTSIARLTQTAVDVTLKELSMWRVPPAWNTESNVAAIAPHFYRKSWATAIALAYIANTEGPVTVRGVLYKAQGLGIFPDTADRYYDQCGSLLLKLRRAKLIKNTTIVDSTRRRLKPSSWSGLSDFAETVAGVYRKDLWARQSHYVEVFVEKDAMAGVLQPVTSEYDIHLNVIRGCVSESFVFSVAEQWTQIQKPIFVYYLGDHDPSGLTIEQDLKRRLLEMTGLREELPSEETGWEPISGITWKRLAINEEDFLSPRLIGFKIKGDRKRKAWQTRHAAYLKEHGDRCVEVDAIPSTEIRARLRSAIESHIDKREWEMLQAQEKIERESMKDWLAGVSGGSCKPEGGKLE